MFVRKRKIRLKNGLFSEIYQLVESYRENGMVKQRVIGLGKYSKPEQVLESWERNLAKVEVDLKVPAEDYKEIRHSRLFKMPVMIQVPIEKAQKRRDDLRKEYISLRTKTKKLRHILQCRANKFNDTTFLQVKSKESLNK